MSEIWLILKDGGASAKTISFQFQCVTWKLEKALENVPYHRFDISEEVQEQVMLLKCCCFLCWLQC